MNARSLEGLLKRCVFPVVDSGSTVSCAVSGGADSAALVALASAHFGPDRVCAWHVDHGLRPESSHEATQVAALATRLGTTFRGVKVDVPAGPNLEARARAARYAALPSQVLTGHTADDLAETVLANLLRGCGLDGLAPMRSGAVVRPLINLRRSETIGVCDAIGWTPIVDPMNADARFLRTRIRGEVVPLLDDVAQRSVTELLVRTAAVVADDVALLDSLAAALDPADAKAIRDAPPPIARRALRGWLQAAGLDEAGHPPTAAVVERALSVARGDSVACDLVNGWRLHRRAQRLTLIPPV